MKLETEREQLERRYFTKAYPSIFFGWKLDEYNQGHRTEPTLAEFRKIAKAIRKRKSYQAFVGLFEKHQKVEMHVWVDCLKMLDATKLFAYKSRGVWVLESAVVAYQDRMLKRMNDAKLRKVVFALEV